MTKLIALTLLLFLAACGGGGDAPLAASPLPVAAPPAAPPVAAVASGTKFTGAPITARQGNLVWTAGGMTYGLAVVESPNASWVALLSASAVGADVAFTANEVIADDSLDLRPLPANDLEIRIYINTVLLPKLNGWFAANSSRFASGFVALPVSSAPVDAGRPAMDRLAARLPQLIELTAAGFVLRP